VGQKANAEEGTRKDFERTMGPW